MTEEELIELDEARALEAEAQIYEQHGDHRAASDIRAGQRAVSLIAIIAARLARTGWMPPADPRLEAAREMMARMSEVQGGFVVAGLWRNPDSDTGISKAKLAYIASCLPEGYLVADLPPVPEKDQ